MGILIEMNMAPPMRFPGKEPACVVVLILVVFNLATAQAPDFLNPQQKGPFQINGLSYLEVGGWPMHFTDTVNKVSVNGTDYPVPTTDQIIAELKATGANLIKLNLTVGLVKNYNDNAYDPAVAFPFEGKPDDIVAFGRRLTAQGIPCLMQPMSLVENVTLGSSATGGDRPKPADGRAWMAQHIPRLVSLARIAESAGCEYFSIFGDEIEHLVADPSLNDLWTGAIQQVRTVFSGRLTSMSSWSGQPSGVTYRHQAQTIALLDVFGIGFFPRYTDHADPTVAELVASYRKNAAGQDSLQGVTDLHTLYGKPILVTDEAYGSFSGANLGEEQLYQSSGPFKIDYQAQVNLYQAFFQAMPALDPNWMLGAVFDSFDRLPYAWKDAFTAPFLGSPGESIRGKPALQTLTQAYQARTPLTVPANGWWYNPAQPGILFALEAENGVVRLASFGFSALGDPEWSFSRCVQVAPGRYSGRFEQYLGGQALNQAPTQPAGLVDGPTVTIVFSGAAAASLQIGNQLVQVRRFQFSDQWASPMLNAARSGWWDRPDQSGRGYFLEVQGNTLLVGGLLYTSNGLPTWFTSTGPVDSAGVFSATLTICSTLVNSDKSPQAPTCRATTDTIRLAFSAPWRATLTLGQEAPVEIRRHRLAEIGWAGPAPSFAHPQPAFQGQAAVVNAASYERGLSPGSIASIFGTGLTRGVSGVVQAVGRLPTALRGTSVLVNGIPAPLFALANADGREQINFQAPYELKGQTTATVIVVNNGSFSPPLLAQVFDVQPAIITDGTRVIAVHSDYSRVTSQSPARPGEVITFYGTGFGSVTPLPRTGEPAGLEPLSTMNPPPVVAIGGHNAIVQFAGLTPGYVGLYQVNVVVPDGLGTGDLPLLMRAAGQLSSLVSIPVQGQLGIPSELIRNGSFSDPFGSDWGFYVGQGATATADRPATSGFDGSFSAHISVTATAATTTAPAFAGVQFFQSDLPLTKGATYQLQFWTRSSNSRGMRVSVYKGGGDNHLYGLSTTFSLGRPDWQRHAVVFQATESAADGRLSFFFGDQAGEIWLDGVSLMAVLGP